MCLMSSEVNLVSADAGCCFLSFAHLKIPIGFWGIGHRILVRIVLIGMTTLANQFTNSNSYNY